MTSRHPEILLSDEEARREMARRTRRGFLVGGAAAIAGAGGFVWLNKARHQDELPWPERKVLEWNGRLGHAYLSDARPVRLYGKDDVGVQKVTGDLGLQKAIPADWGLNVAHEDDEAVPLMLSDVKLLPRIDMITRFCCIEGWSVVTHWAGARFADFTRRYLPPGKKPTSYVSLATPDGDYYVGLDMKSALHPQTLLAYEMNGAPLTPIHGAPLRLVIPVKYGIKNIKRIGQIQYTNKKPGDYWAEEGYDWFAGL